MRFYNVAFFVDPGNKPKVDLYTQRPSTQVLDIRPQEGLSTGITLYFYDLADLITFASDLHKKVTEEYFQFKEKEKSAPTN